MECGGFVLKTLKKACVFIGMVVGAGFASGREITDYFLLFGDKWKAGMLLSGMLFLIVSTAVTDIINQNGIKTYSEYLDVVMGGKSAVFTEWVSGLFFFVMFFAMTAAAGSAAREIFGVNYWLGVAAILIVCAFIILHGMEAVEIVSIILVPLLILGITAIGVRAGDETIEVVDKGGSIALSAFIYVSYNTITAASVIAQSDRVKNRYDGIITGILCGAAMAFMGYIIGRTILSAGSEVLNTEIPFAAASKELGNGYYLAYVAVFLASVLTTAVCDGMAAIDFAIEKIHISRERALIMLIVLALLFSFISFSDFVSKVYPLFGIAGVLQLMNTVKYFIKKK